MSSTCNVHLDQQLSEVVKSGLEPWRLIVRALLVTASQMVSQQRDELLTQSQIHILLHLLTLIHLSTDQERRGGGGGG